MIWFYIYKILKTHQKNLLDLINEFCKAAGYKINIQKAVAFLYTKNELSEEKENGPIYKSIKNNKIFRTKFKQRSERSHNENCKILMKEIGWQIIGRYPVFMDWKNYC